MLLAPLLSWYNLWIVLLNSQNLFKTDESLMEKYKYFITITLMPYQEKGTMLRKQFKCNQAKILLFLVKIQACKKAEAQVNG